jgi:hypothetical protein
VPTHLREYIEHYSRSAVDKVLHDPRARAVVTVADSSTMRENASCLAFGFEPAVTRRTISIDSKATEADVCARVSELFGGADVRVWRCNASGAPVAPIDPSSMHSFGARDALVFAEEGDGFTRVSPGQVHFWAKFYFAACDAPLQFVGRFEVAARRSVRAVFAALNDAVGFPRDVPLSVSREMRAFVRPVRDDDTFAAAAIETGSILIFAQRPEDAPRVPRFALVPRRERAPPADGVPLIDGAALIGACNPATVTEYLDFQTAPFTITVHELAQPCTPRFRLRFPATASFPQLKALIAAAMQIEYRPEADAMLLHTRRPGKGRPARTATALGNWAPNVFFHAKGGDQNIVFVNVLRGVPEAEAANMLSVKTVVADDGILVSRTGALLLPLSISKAGLARALAHQLGVPECDCARVVCEWNHTVAKVFVRDEELIFVSGAAPLRVDLRCDPDREYVKCFHATMDKYHALVPCGRPFLFALVRGESFAETRARIGDALRMTAAELEKVAFILTRPGTTHPGPPLSHTERLESADLDTLHLAICHPADRMDSKNRQRYWRHRNETVKMYN